MTLRDWFAGQESLVEWDTPDAVPAKAQWRAALKYIRADAMIVARENETTS